jgi:5'-phosphate synthase pdxT subunit
MVVGILALQGCCAPHQARFRELGVETRLIRYADQLAGVDALVLPGGETTTMLKTAGKTLWPAIQSFTETRPVWGICAGSILLAKRVQNPTQFSLGILDMTVERNAYGAQNESFIGTVEIDLDPSRSLEAVFIRAPVITSVGDSITVLSECKGNPVMVTDGRHIATTFHPELSDDTAVHHYFLANASRPFSAPTLDN